MDQSQKLAMLQALDERSLRRDVLIPLLGRMGYNAVGEYHGPREHGKDIVCFDLDRLGERRYLAVVAKTTDLSGSVSSDSGLLEVIHQAEQCFNEDYNDLFGMRTITMDEVWVVTSGRVVSGAADAIMGKLKKTNLSKLTRVIAGPQLIGIIDRHFPSYWQTTEESTESLRSQRDRLIAFVREMLGRMGSAEATIDAVLSGIVNSPWKPIIQLPDVSRHRIRSASAYKVELAPTSRNYPPGLTSPECGDLARALRAVQKAVQHELYEVEETLERVDMALATSDPEEFLIIFNTLKGEYPFRRNGIFSSAVRDAQSLLDGFSDVWYFLERAESAGRREEFLQLVSSLEGLEGKVQEYLAGIDSPDFSLAWTVVGQEVVLAYEFPVQPGNGFTTSHTLEITTHERSGPKTRRVTARDVIDVAQLALREYLEESLPPEDEP